MGLGRGALPLASQPGMRMHTHTYSTLHTPLPAQEPFLDARVRGEHRTASADCAQLQTASQPQVRVRRCLRTLLRMSLLSGSIRDGIQVHDLVRGYAIARARPDERSSLQRSLLAELCAHPAIAVGRGPTVAFEAGGAAVAAYLRARLADHAADACMLPPPVSTSVSGATASVPVDDGTVRLAAEHPTEWVQITLARALGVARLRAVAEAAAQSRLWLRAGQAYFLAGMASAGGRGGGSMRDSWQALRSVEPLSAASVELEARVIRGLILGKSGSQPSEGFKINSPEYAAVSTRLVPSRLGRLVGRAARDSPLHGLISEPRAARRATHSDGGPIRGGHSLGVLGCSA